jgi:hypothetical protein
MHWLALYIALKDSRSGLIADCYWNKIIFADHIFSKPGCAQKNKTSYNVENGRNKAVFNKAVFNKAVFNKDVFSTFYSPRKPRSSKP